MTHPEAADHRHPRRGAGDGRGHRGGARAGGPGRGRRASRRRFGGGVLVLAGGVSMLAGIVSGAAVGGVRPPWQAIPDAAGVTASVVPPGTSSTADSAAGGAARAATEPDRALEEAVEAVASPAQPALIDMEQVGADGLTLADRSVGLLSREVPSSGAGELVVVPGAAPAPHPDRPVRTVRVEVEQGLAVDGALFAATVMATLNDPRGWGGDGSMSFARTDGPAEIRVVLASPDKVDAMCAPLDTGGRYSCGRYGHAALNYARWVGGTDEYLALSDMTTYRQYLVNHEVGHLLGRPHVQCPAAGARAPIMQQQSIGVAPCTPNAWPFPDNPLPPG